MLVEKKKRERERDSIKNTFDKLYLTTKFKNRKCALKSKTQTKNFDSIIFSLIE